ncbi:MAG: hypothetical protein ABSE20_10240 [Acetobacteraceae bacterium]|jgi:hypothetical protein
MTHFNLVHVVGKGIRGTEAYQEVIDSLLWGVRQLGHDATYSVNACHHNATNILFGAHLLPDLLINSPDDTIYYNLEQISGHPQYDQCNPKDTVKLIAAKLRIRDYTGANIATWNSLNLKHTVKLVPVGYAPILTRIEKAEQQDIDVLIYGAVGEQRLAVFASLGKLVNGGLSTVFASGLYGAGRDGLIARSKIVLNVNNIPRSKIFEIVRVSYLLANAKAVVADIYPDSYIEQDIASGVIFAPTEMIATTCWDLLADDARRDRLERQGFACIARRDIRILLAAALA